MLQIKATKRWSIYNPKVKQPLRGPRFQPGTPSGDISDPFEFGSGSAVYLPLRRTGATVRPAAGIRPVGIDSEIVWRRFSDEVLATDVSLFTDLLRQRFHREPADASLPGEAPRRASHRGRDGRRDPPPPVLRPGAPAARPVRPALRFVTTADEFAVQDLPDCLDAEGKPTLVTRLLGEEVLQPSPP